MPLLYQIYAAAFGAAIGSFLNVVIFRFHTGKGLHGRSFCPSCGRELPWYDLVPILSFVFLRGKCRVCRARISWQYPLVELATALAFLFLVQGYLSGPQDTAASVSLALSLVLWPLLIVMFVYDLRHKIIPDAFSYSFAAAGLLYQLSDGFFHGFGPFVLANLAAGPLLFLPFYCLWRFSGGKWMGLGDGKLALGMGWMLGLGGGISAVMYGFWYGAVAGILLIVVTRLPVFGRTLKTGEKHVTMKSELPFAPFLIAGIATVQFLGISLFTLFS